ncbi:hypothetical protein RUND412_001482 [Rhizina undulata]
MTFPVFRLVLVMVTVGLTSLCAYYWYVVKHLGLPISSLLPATALLLPLLNAVAVNFSTTSAVQDSRFRGSPKWNMQIGIIQFLLVIVETVIITLSATNLDAESVSCPLERQWQKFYRAKNGPAIRTIQDTLGCCGLNSPLDRAYPFPSKGVNGSVCRDTMHGNKSCFGPWRQQEQIASGVFMSVALITLVSKVFVLVATRSNNSYLQQLVYGEFPAYKRVSSGFIEPPEDEEENENNGDRSRGRIADVEGNAAPRTAVSTPENGLRLRPDERTRLLVEDGSRRLYEDESEIWGNERPERERETSESVNVRHN